MNSVKLQAKEVQEKKVKKINRKGVQRCLHNISCLLVNWWVIQFQIVFHPNDHVREVCEHLQEGTFINIKLKCNHSSQL